MKNSYLCFLTGTVILFLSSILFSVRVCADEPPTVYYDVTDYGADGTDEGDDRSAINKVLAFANEYSGTVNVYIPDGNYYISGCLFIYSNTILTLGENAVINEMPSFSGRTMIIGAHLTEEGNRCRCSVGTAGTVCNGYGYSKCCNITIDGGKWVSYKDPDTGNCPGNMIIAFRHSREITIKNTTCKNASGHAINLSGVDTALVSNVNLDTANAKKDDTVTSQYIREAIHLDYCTEDGESLLGIPYDNTPSKNITVENCNFSNGFAGVGNHHTLPAGGEISSGIVVRGCTFNNMESYAVGEYSVDHLTVEDCTATNCMIFALISGSSNVSLTGNKFDAGGLHDFNDVHSNRSGINISGSSNLTVTDNSVSNTPNPGISVKKCTGGTIASNTITGVGKYGIEYRTSTGMTVSGNNVSSTDSALFLIGTEEIDCGAAVTDNMFNSAEGYDIYLGKYANSCSFSGNTLSNYTFLKIADTFTGTLNLPVMSSVTVASPSYVYTGAEIKPQVTVKDTLGRTLTEGTDYDLKYKNCTNVGTAQVTVHGRSRSIYYDQDMTASYNITAKKITPRIKLSTTSYVYNSKTRHPSVKVYDGNVKVSKDQYTVEYSKGCKEVGTYKVKVKLKNNYSGSKTASFKIKKSKSKMTVTVRKKIKTVEHSSSKNRYIRATSVFKISKARGTRSYKMVSGKKKYFAVNKTTGKITVKAGTPEGTYKLKIKITADGGRNYKSKSVTKTIRIKVI